MTLSTVDNVADNKEIRDYGDAQPAETFMRFQTSLYGQQVIQQGLARVHAPHMLAGVPSR